MPLFYGVPARETHIWQIGKWLWSRKLPITTIRPEIYSISLPYWEEENVSFLRKWQQKRMIQKLGVFVKEKQGKLILANCLKPVCQDTIPWQIQENLKLPLLYDLLAFYFQIGDIKPQQVDLHFVCQSFSKETVEIMKQLASLYRSVHIVSEYRVPYTRLADKLYAEYAQLVTVSNHKRNALKQAKWIINYDMPIEELTAYTINRNSTLFLLQTRMQEMPIGLCRMVVQDMVVEGGEQWKQYIHDLPLEPNDFTIQDLVSGCICQLTSRRHQQERLQSLGIHITALQGINGILDSQEVQKTCRETIDKTGKLH